MEKLDRCILKIFDETLSEQAAQVDALQLQDATGNNSQSLMKRR
jgi:hypothetical protein